MLPENEKQVFKRKIPPMNINKILFTQIAARNFNICGFK